MSKEQAHLKTFSFAVFIAFILIETYRAFASNGSWTSDEIAHYMQVLSISKNPLMLIDTWTRPLFSIVYFLPVNLGLGYARLFSVLLFACLAIFLLRKDDWSLVLLLILQPVFFTYIPTTLTEPLFALLLTLILWFYRERRFYFACFLAGLLPLIRLEGYFLIIPVIIGVIYNREWRAVPLCLIGTLFWWILSLCLTSSPLWLINSLFASAGESISPKTSVFFWLSRLVVMLAPFVFVLVILSLKKSLREARLSLFMLVVFLSLYTFLSSTGRFESGGGLRYLMQISPCFAFLAAVAFREMGRFDKKWLWIVSVFILIYSVFNLIYGLSLPWKLRHSIMGDEIGSSMPYFGFTIFFILVFILVNYYPSKKPLLISSSVLISALLLIIKPSPLGINLSVKGYDEVESVNMDIKDWLLSNPFIKPVYTTQYRLLYEFRNDTGRMKWWIGRLRLEGNGRSTRFRKGFIPDGSYLLYDTYFGDKETEGIIRSNPLIFNEIKSWYTMKGSRRIDFILYKISFEDRVSSLQNK